jgi:hypothetical protein
MQSFLYKNKEALIIVSSLRNLLNHSRFYKAYPNVGLQLLTDWR